MWIRSALWFGHSEDEDFFQSEVQRVSVHMRQLPGVKDFHILWPKRLDENAPEIACQFLYFFDSQEALDAMLAAPERAEVRKELAPAAATFRGTVTHVDFQIGS